MCRVLKKWTWYCVKMIVKNCNPALLTTLPSQLYHTYIHIHIISRQNIDSNILFSKRIMCNFLSTVCHAKLKWVSQDQVLTADGEFSCSLTHTHMQHIIYTHTHISHNFATQKHQLYYTHILYFVHLYSPLSEIWMWFILMSYMSSMHRTHEVITASLFVLMCVPQLI